MNNTLLLTINIDKWYKNLRLGFLFWPCSHSLTRVFAAIQTYGHPGETKWTSPLHSSHALGTYQINFQIALIHLCGWRFESSKHAWTEFRKTDLSFPNWIPTSGISAIKTRLSQWIRPLPTICSDEKLICLVSKVPARKWLQNGVVFGAFQGFEL